MTDITDITTRRNFLVVAAGLAATIATALAVAASPGACLAPDPIFAAIDAHVAALAAFDIAVADCELNDAVFDNAAAERARHGGRSLEQQRAVCDAAYRLFRVSVGASMDVAGLVRRLI
jgi:hypothetical protein